MTAAVKGIKLKSTLVDKTVSLAFMEALRERKLSLIMMT
jgi:hypothetical protein